MHNRFSQDDLNAVSLLVAYSAVLHAQLKVMRTHIPNLPAADREKVAAALNCMEGCYSHAQQAAESAMAACSSGDYDQFLMSMEQFVLHVEPARVLYNTALCDIANAEVEQVASNLKAVSGKLECLKELADSHAANESINVDLMTIDTHLTKAAQALATMRRAHSKGSNPEPILFAIAKGQANDYIKLVQNLTERSLKELNK